MVAAQLLKMRRKCTDLQGSERSEAMERCKAWKWRPESARMIGHSCFSCVVAALMSCAGSKLQHEIPFSAFDRT